MNEKRQSIFSLLPEQLKQRMRELDVPEYRAGQILEWSYRKNVFDFAGMRNLPARLRRALADTMDTLTLRQKEKFVSGADGTAKYLFRTHDAEFIESVWIPARQRATACVSTQIGCGLRCAFCAGGIDGLKRSLDTDEIVSQVLLLKKDNAPLPLTHIVIMGMGEPLMNYERTLRAVRIFNHPECLGLAARRITISTAGLPAQIRRLAAEGLQFELSISLHAADERLRGKLMPANEQYPLAEVIAAAREYFRRTRRVITFEYVIINGVNDSDGDALKVCRLLGKFPCKINLIPFNAVAGMAFRAPEAARVERFVRLLKKNNLNVTVRRPRGADIRAACGQLRRAHSSSGELSKELSKE